MILVPIRSNAKAPNSQGSQGVSGCELLVGSAFGSLPVPGKLGNPLACAGTSSSLGVPLINPTVKMLATVLALSVVDSGSVMLALVVFTLKVYNPAESCKYWLACSYAMFCTSGVPLAFTLIGPASGDR